MKIKQLELGIGPTLKVGNNFFKPSAKVVIELEEGENLTDVSHEIQDDLRTAFMDCLETEMDIVEEIEAIDPDDKPKIRKRARKILED